MSDSRPSSPSTSRPASPKLASPQPVPQPLRIQVISPHSGTPAVGTLTTHADHTSTLNITSAPPTTSAPTPTPISSTPASEHVLQIIFDPAAPNRPRQCRRPSTAGEYKIDAQDASCFVHALLETTRVENGAGEEKAGGGLIDGVQEGEKRDGEEGENLGVAGVDEVNRVDGGVDRRGDLAKLLEKHPTLEREVTDGKLGDVGVLGKMSKQQLNDMVLGVRELSKHLASMVIHMKIRTAFLLTKPGDKGLVEYTRVLSRWLLEKGYFVYVDENLRGNEVFDVEKVVEGDERWRKRLKFWTAKMCATKPHLFDIVITLGGDGTVLYASWLFQKVVPPILSFALGSLGFLTKFDFNNHATILSNLTSSGVSVGLRLRFEGTIMRATDRDGIPRESRNLGDEILAEDKVHRPAESFAILNEIVVDRGPNPTLSTTELYVDEMFLTTVSADGVCVATPTGSTAYSLAAGGSLTHPDLPGMLVTVICAHSLNFRPLILPDSVMLRIAVPFDARTTAWVSFDGRHRVELEQGDYVSIVASRFPFPVIQNKKDNKDWFDSIRRTMNWGDRITQKAFKQTS